MIYKSDINYYSTLYSLGLHSYTYIIIMSLFALSIEFYVERVRLKLQTGHYAWFHLKLHSIRSMHGATNLLICRFVAQCNEA